MDSLRSTAKPSWMKCSSSGLLTMLICTQSGETTTIVRLYETPVEPIYLKKWRSTQQSIVSYDFHTCRSTEFDIFAVLSVFFENLSIQRECYGSVLTALEHMLYVHVMPRLRYFTLRPTGRPLPRSRRRFFWT